MKNATEPRFINTVLSALMEEVECGSALFVRLTFMMEFSGIGNCACAEQ